MPDIERLARIIKMFDASPGEASAAFARADEIIRASELSWADVLPMIFNQQIEPVRLSHVEFGHVDQCRDFLRNQGDYLSAWERRFLRSVIEKMFLSEREAARLAQIAHIVDFRRRARDEFLEKRGMKL